MESRVCGKRSPIAARPQELLKLPKTLLQRGMRSCARQLPKEDFLVLRRLDSADVSRFPRAALSVADLARVRRPGIAGCRKNSPVVSVCCAEKRSANVQWGATAKKSSGNSYSGPEGLLSIKLRGSNVK
jgi:hypothetical protein